MSAVQQAAANTVLRIANLFEQNCAIKHGLPKVGGPDRIDADPATPPAPTPIHITNNIPAAPAANSPSPSGATGTSAVKDSFLRRAAPWLLSAVGVTGAGALGYALHPAAVNPPAASVATPQTADGSLLQALEDRGLHLPEGQWPTK